MKKLITLLLFLLFQAGLFAQNNDFIIKGKIGNLSTPSVIFLKSKMKPHIIDSAILENGRFEFKTTVPNQYLWLSVLVLYHNGISPKDRDIICLKEDDYIQFLMAPGETINFTSNDSLKFAEISGSKTNEEHKILQELLKPCFEEANQYKTEFIKASPEQKKSKEFMAYLEKAEEKIIELQKKIFFKFIKENPDSWLSLDAMITMKKLNPDGLDEILRLRKLYNSFTPRIKNTERAKNYLASLKRMEKSVVGAIAPDFTQNDPEGNPVKLSDFKGKYLLLDFWASWCGPCRAENPNVLKAYNKYHEKGLEIIAVSLDEKKEAWLKTVAEDKLPWKQLSDLKGWRNEVAKLYEIHSIPQNCLIDPNGVIVAKNLRGEALEAKLAEIFKQD